MKHTLLFLLFSSTNRTTKSVFFSNATSCGNNYQLLFGKSDRPVMFFIFRNTGGRGFKESTFRKLGRVNMVSISAVKIVFVRISRNRPCVSRDDFTLDLHIAFVRIGDLKAAADSQLFVFM